MVEDILDKTEAFGGDTNGSKIECDEQPVPSVAVRWVVYNTFTNVELATLSNVCRAWREIVAQFIVDTAASSECGGNRSLPAQTQAPPARLAHWKRLLLPSLMRHFCWTRSNFLSTQDRKENHRKEDEEDDDETYCVAWFHPDGIRFKRLTLQNATSLTLPPSASLARDDALNLGSCVLYQWDGYSEAIDVLNPFGYTRSLLRIILEKMHKKEGVGKSLSLSPSSPWKFPTSCGRKSSSIAVRGATYARPEGYCQCWDKDDADLFNHKNETWKIKRRLHKQELEQVVLPKVLLSERGDEDTIETCGVVRPVVQFLNIDSNHAVRLVTPKFEKPIFTPLTVFCVGIATEDGCFFSGLRKKFEMGHMYPTDCNAEISDDRSPICLNAEYDEREVCLSENEFEQVPNNTYQVKDVFLGPDCKCFNSLNNDDSDSDSLDDDSSEEGCDDAVRGQLGPGAWHCYVAIFDGNQSIIRIDGEEESTTYASTIPRSFQACLDGITIGSDHAFDMSLCFGQGSDGEGEGSIAELAFFKGRMHPKDIASLELHLMTKHGIPFPVKSRNERIRDDYLSRLAHKLMDQSPTRADRNEDFGSEDISVPLRYMTELRQVAWQQRDKVTGRRLTIKRIGNKLRNGSASEW